MSVRDVAGVRDENDATVYYRPIPECFAHDRGFGAQFLLPVSAYRNRGESA